MATTGVDFVMQNNQTALDGNTVTAIPYVVALERQASLSLSGRNPGGGSFRGTSASVTNNMALVDDMNTSAANSPYAKNGCIMLVLNGSLGHTIQLSNTTTAVTNAITVSTAGDTVFANWNQLVIYNMSGVDGTTAAPITVASASANGANWPVGGTNATTIQGSSRLVYESTGNGQVVNATKTGILITGNNGNIVSVVIMGS